MEQKFGLEHQQEIKRTEDFDRRSGQTKESRMEIVKKMASDMKYTDEEARDMSQPLFDITRTPIALMM